MVAARDSWSDRSTALADALARTAAGDRRAFADLYQASSAQLYAVVLRITRDAGLADEVLQEVYVKVWQSAGTFDADRAQPLTWLTSIARHRAIDSLRRRQSEPATISLHREDEEGEAMPDDDHHASNEPGPLEQLERASEARSLTHCMGRLSTEQRQCVALAYYQGLSHAEVAEHLTQPLGTVKSWVRRGLMALKDCLGHQALRT